METEEGIVEKTSRRKAWVRIQQKAGCATCHSRDSCEIVSKNKQLVIEVSNELHAETGDIVELTMPEGALLRLSLLVYFFPVVALVIGALLGSRLAVPLQVDPTIASIVTGFGAMSIFFCLLKWIEHRTHAKNKYAARISRVLSSKKRSSGMP